MEQKKPEKTTTQQPMSPMRNYFTPEINQKIAEMTIEEMYALLKDLPNTELWIAILKYNEQRMLYSQNSLFSGDPFKEPTNMARNQGIMLGLSDMQNAVIQLNTPTPKSEQTDEDDLVL